MKRRIPPIASAFVFLVLALLAGVAAAQPRAWLDRDRIAGDETVTLNIEADGVARPDYGPLEADFVLSGRSSRSRFDASGAHTLHAVALRPRRTGRIAIPALRVGSQRTAPLVLQVTGTSAPAPSRAGDDVFVESAPDDRDPYVQQSVGWVVRLYSATPLISGQLEQPAPDGASLQQVGDDARYSREVAGRRYEVVERRYLLIPERSGALTVPGARFEGRGAGGFFDELFGNAGGRLAAQAPAQVLQVRPMPANAPQPWLPLRDLRLRYVATPGVLRAGSAGAVAIEMTADGATAAQLPELQLPPIEGVQVFPEPPQADERFRDGRPQVTLTRRFSLVPTRAGPVQLDALRVGWWDAGANAARMATLPPMRWQVQPGGAGASSPASPGASVGDVVGAGVAGAVAGADPPAAVNPAWIAATLLFAVLWLVTLLWALQRRNASNVAPASQGARRPQDIGSRPHLQDLRRALDTGGLGDVADLLRAMAHPQADSVDALLVRLDDPAQREALQALQAARWGGGDGVHARRLLREAFARGPRFRSIDAPTQVAEKRDALLPPLYPR